jgi:hypothetical protein
LRGILDLKMQNQRTLEEQRPRCPGRTFDFVGVGVRETLNDGRQVQHATRRLPVFNDGQQLSRITSEPRAHPSPAFVSVSRFGVLQADISADRSSLRLIGVSKLFKIAEASFGRSLVRVGNIRGVGSRVIVSNHFVRHIENSDEANVNLSSPSLYRAITRSLPAQDR